MSRDGADLREFVMLMIHRESEKHDKVFNGTLIMTAVQELARRLRLLGENSPGLNDVELSKLITAIVKQLAKP